jgi:hypothetical protein
MVTLLWVIATILAIDFLIVVGFVIRELRHRRRIKREVSELDTLWRAPATAPIHRARREGALRVEHRLRRPPPVARSRTAARLIGNVAFGTAVVAMLVVVAVATFGGAPSSRPPETLASGPLGSSPDAVAEGQRPGSAFVDGTSEQPVEADEVDPSFPKASTAPPSAGQGFVPETFAAEASSWRSIVLEWTEVPEAIKYKIERSTAVDGSGGWMLIVTTDSRETTYRDSGLEPGTTYYYRVTAVPEVGTAPPSDVISATTPVEPPPPTSLDAVATSSSTISLTWVDVEGATGYRIERASADDPGWTTIATAGADVTEYTDGGLTADTKYRYRVYSVNEGGESDSSNTAHATTSEDPSPEPDPGSDPEDPADGSGSADDGGDGTVTDGTVTDGTTGTDGMVTDGTVTDGAVTDDAVSPDATAP